jgi:hypothetical protein
LKRENQKTIKIDPKQANIGRFFTVPGYKPYLAYAAITNDLFAEPTLVKAFRLEVQDKDEVLLEEGDIVYKSTERDDNNLIQANFDFKKVQVTPQIPITETEAIEATTMSAEDELLQWHHRMGHVSMAQTQSMATQGHLPIKLAKCRIPLCQACVFGKLTRKPWRGKTKNIEVKVKEVTFPGQFVSVDQLESPMAGFVGQMKGILTKKRYNAAIIFVDHFTKYSFVHLQSTTNAIDTLEAKCEFEKLATSFDVNIRHYHADNGRFAESVGRKKSNKRTSF